MRGFVYCYVIVFSKPLNTLNAPTSDLVKPYVQDVAQALQCIMYAQNQWCKRVVIKNIFPSSLWFSDKTLQAVKKVIILATRTSNVLVFSSLVRAFNVFNGLEKDDYLAINETSQYGFQLSFFAAFEV
jgi:hypothetical protein